MAGRRRRNTRRNSYASQDPVIGSGTNVGKTALAWKQPSWTNQDLTYFEVVFGPAFELTASVAYDDRYEGWIYEVGHGGKHDYRKVDEIKLFKAKARGSHAKALNVATRKLFADLLSGTYADWY